MKNSYLSPVYNVKAIPIEKIQANAYNPNRVAPPEMKLLYLSIKEDGYTQPVVCYYIADKDIYEVVDGFHRYLVMKTCKDIYEREKGKLPVAVIDKPLGERIASAGLARRGLDEQHRRGTDGARQVQRMDIKTPRNERRRSFAPETNNGVGRVI